MISVTKPFLPPKEEYDKIINEAWKRNWLTNNGPILNEFETKFKKQLSLKNFSFVSNGTIALQLAIKALNLTGEILTTPFSFIATTSSILWESCTPVFVDINKKDFNIDPSKMGSLITEKTSGILVTHVYGNPCKINDINDVAEKYNLKVIYDAAHCFGTKYDGQSVLNYGDISIISFHATKLFHTIEGGGVVANEEIIYEKIRSIRNFGFERADSFSDIGINAKNSEFHAAMGVVNLDYSTEILARRKSQYLRYQSNLLHANCKFIKQNEEGTFNYAYCPIILSSEKVLLKLVEVLNNNYVYPRRYFYPSLNTVSYLKGGSCPISEDYAKRVLTLPLYHNLTERSIDFICKIIINNI